MFSVRTPITARSARAPRKPNERKASLAFALPRHHAGQSTFARPREPQNPIAPSLLADRRWHRRAIHVWQETHSRSRFPLRRAGGHVRNTIREFPHPIHLSVFVPQGHHNLRPEILSNGRRTSSDLHRHR